MPHVAGRWRPHGWHFCCPNQLSVSIAGPVLSVNSLAVAARQALRILRWQAGWIVALAIVLAIVWGGSAGWSALAGGSIGMVWTVYMAFALFKHSVNHGVRLSAMTFFAGWMLKVVLTISLLVIAFRAPGVVPLALLAGLFGTMVAYWAWLTFRVNENHADNADGK